MQLGGIIFFMHSTGVVENVHAFEGGMKVLLSWNISLDPLLALIVDNSNTKLYNIFYFGIKLICYTFQSWFGIQS